MISKSEAWKDSKGQVYGSKEGAIRSEINIWLHKKNPRTDISSSWHNVHWSQALDIISKHRKEFIKFLESLDE